MKFNKILNQIAQSVQSQTGPILNCEAKFEDLGSNVELETFIKHLQDLNNQIKKVANGRKIYIDLPSNDEGPSETPSGAKVEHVSEDAVQVVLY